METGDIYLAVREIIAKNNFGELYTLEIEKPVAFNWVTSVFENIHVRYTPGNTALIWTNGESELTYSFLELSAQCNQLLNLLREYKIQKGDTIFCQLPLLPENWITLLAGIKGGYQMIPAATILGEQDIFYRFDKLLPDVVIADNDNATKIDQAISKLGRSPQVKIIVGESQDGWINFNDLNNHAKNADGVATKSDDPLFLFFTSGTTGMPKIVTHTHFSYPFGHLTTAAWIGLRSDDRHYNISQPGWAKFAWSSFFAPWSVGATLFSFYQPRFHAAEQLSMIEKYGITTFCAPPTALRMLILEDFSNYQFKLRECVAAGEPLNPEIIDSWRKGTGLTIRDGYGQTESTLLVSNLPGEKLKQGSMGKPTFLYEIVIADENGKELPPNEEGNITVRTDNGKPSGIFSNYYGDSEKMSDVFRHGLYYTGDKAYKDADGYIWFVGRDDDVIKTSDYRVGPFEVESVILEHESVVESAVVASPHLLRGSMVKAFVVLKKGSDPSEEMAKLLFGYCKHHLANYKLPRIIEFVSELPKTISGKIRRIELRACEAQYRLENIKREMEYFL